jgi:single-strand DNA-binding protein
MELNKVLIIGNLTRDPESRFLQNGSQVVKMTVASNRRMGSGDNRKDEVLYLDVETWNKTAELCAQYLRKGSQVFVEGRLKMDSYQTQTGEKRTKLFVVAERVSFGSKASGAEGSMGAPSGSPSGYNAAPSRPAYPASTPAADSYGDDAPSYGDHEGTEDDLPF